MARATKPKRPHRRNHHIETADLAVAARLSGWRANPLVRAAGSLADLADQPPLYMICTAVAVTGIARGDGKLLRTGLKMLAAEWIATKAKSLIKHRIDRTRPEVPAEGGAYQMERGHSHASALNSFPSGHTAGAVAVARVVSAEYPQHAITAAVASALVGAIQIPRARHFMSDIAVGAAIGLAAGGLAARL